MSEKLYLLELTGRELANFRLLPGKERSTILEKLDKLRVQFREDTRKPLTDD